MTILTVKRLQVLWEEHQEDTATVNIARKNHLPGAGKARKAQLPMRQWSLNLGNQANFQWSCKGDTERPAANCHLRVARRTPTGPREDAWKANCQWSQFWPRVPASARVLRRRAANYHVNPLFQGPKIDVHARSMSMIKPISRRLDRDHEKRANEASWSSPSLILSSISFSSIISSHFVLKNPVTFVIIIYLPFFLTKL